MNDLIYNNISEIENLFTDKKIGMNPRRSVTQG